MNEIKINLVTRIFHEARIKLKLSRTEYEIADLIYKLQSSPNAYLRGWCQAGISKLSRMTGFGKATVSRAQDALRYKKLLMEHPDESAVCMTRIWYETVVKPYQKERSITEQLRGYTFQNGTEAFQNGTEAFQNGTEAFHFGTYKTKKETKSRDLEKEERGTHPPDFSENERMDLESQATAIAENSVPPPVAVAPPAWLICQQQLLDFFDSQIGQGQKDMMSQQVGFDENRHGDFTEVLKIFSEKNQDNYKFLNNPVAAFSKSGYTWLRKQKQIKTREYETTNRPSRTTTNSTTTHRERVAANRAGILAGYRNRRNRKRNLDGSPAEDDTVGSRAGSSSGVRTA